MNIYQVVLFLSSGCILIGLGYVLISKSEEYSGVDFLGRIFIMIGYISALTGLISGFENIYHYLGTLNP